MRRHCSTRCPRNSACRRRGSPSCSSTNPHGPAARRARLLLHHLGTFQYTDPGPPGGPTPAGPDFRSLPVGQVRVRFQAASATLEEQALVNAVVSTAEPLSVFPEWSWRTFPSGIQWLSPQPGLPVPRRWPFRDQHPFRFGRVRILVYDEDRNDLAESAEERGGRQLAAVWMTARFLHGDPPDVKEPLFGLDGHGINPRRLVHDPLATCQPAYPEETRLRQQWWLHDE